MGNAIARRKAWAYALLRRCQTPPPPYGSHEWLALPDDSPYKVGSVVRAAEAWATDGDNLASDLEREIDERRRADKALEDAEYQAASSEHRRRWRHLRIVPARDPNPGAPRPGDFPGRNATRVGDLDAS